VYERRQSEPEPSTIVGNSEGDHDGSRARHSNVHAPSACEAQAVRFAASHSVILFRAIVGANRLCQRVP
jgi:hypothetical protein